jgi:conjugative transfer signal peptidase TraF
LSRSAARIGFVGAILAGLGLVLAPEIADPRPALIWNASASAPLGLYRLRPADDLAVGDLVAVAPPPVLAAWLDGRGYAPLGVVLMKRVAAVAPSKICRTGPMVQIDGAPAGLARAVDRQGRPLPVWQGCRRLAADQVFLLNPSPTSLDGRYFGALPRDAVLGRVRRLRPFAEPGHAE